MKLLRQTLGLRNKAEDVAAIEAEAIEGVLLDLESFAQTHARLKRSMGNTDDLMGFVALQRAKARLG